MLEVDGLCKSYHGHQVLTPVRFVLPAGACIGITGENGAGKSTLLRLLAQTERPDGGDIRYKGDSVLGDRKFLRQKLGYVPQQSELMEELTVRQQLKLWQSASGAEDAFPKDIMELLDIGPMLKKPVSALSGGMQKRVSIAMALMRQPEILVMDEATTGLDPDHRERLLCWLEGYLARGGRIVWCSHDQGELERLCGGCLHLQGGRLQEK